MVDVEVVMIEMDVVDDNGDWKPWWKKFYYYYEKQGVNMENADNISQMLRKWNAIDKDVDSTKFYFKNEQDQMFFMLRWL